MGRGTGPSIVPITVLLILLSSPSLVSGSDQNAEERDIEIVSTIPHNQSSFTQGLEMLGSSIFESSGLYGHSRISEVDSNNGDIIRQTEIQDSYFGEGITVKGESIFMLTWREGVVLEFDISNLSIIGNFSFQGEGWGICYNGEHFVTSNGTSELSFRDPVNFEIEYTKVVTWDGEQVSNLNELECVGDKIYANIWMDDTILRISASSGKVDFFSSPLAITSTQGDGPEEVLNGIAFDRNSDSFWITGKNWTHMYLVNFIIPEETPSPNENSQLPTTISMLGVALATSLFVFRIIRKKKEPETPNFKDSPR